MEDRDCRVGQLRGVGPWGMEKMSESVRKELRMGLLYPGVDLDNVPSVPWDTPSPGYVYRGSGGGDHMVKLLIDDPGVHKPYCPCSLGTGSHIEHGVGSVLGLMRSWRVVVLVLELLLELELVLLLIVWA